MPKTYIVTAEMAADIRQKMRVTTCVVACRRMEAVALRGEGKNNREVADIKKYNESYVSQLVSDFIKHGMDSFIDKRSGGNNKNLTQSQEVEFLDGFKKDAEEGKIITIDEIAKAYDELTNKERKSNSTVYYLLKKHGWRTIMPRGQHPKKASDEDILSSKKLTLR